MEKIKYKRLNEIFPIEVTQIYMKNILKNTFEETQIKKDTENSHLTNMEELNIPFIKHKNFKGKFNISLNSKHEYNSSLIEYFQEECRLLCRRNTFNQNFY